MLAKLICALTIAAALSGRLNADDKKPGGANLIRVIDLAHEYLEQAEANACTDEDMQLIPGIRAIRRQLTINSFKIPNGSDFAVCHSTMIAHMFFDKEKTVIVCQYGMRLSNRDLAQSLIHEAAHKFLRLYDECQASNFEVKVVALAGEVPYHNAYIYYKQCKIPNLPRTRFTDYSF